MDKDRQEQRAHVILRARRCRIEIIVVAHAQSHERDKQQATHEMMATQAGKAVFANHLRRWTILRSEQAR